jgi:hypothetical protein
MLTLLLWESQDKNRKTVTGIGVVQKLQFLNNNHLKRQNAEYFAGLAS